MSNRSWTRSAPASARSGASTTPSSRSARWRRSSSRSFSTPKAFAQTSSSSFAARSPAYTPPELPNYAFEDETLFDSHRGLLRTIRRWLRPILKLFFNPNPLIQALHIQAHLNTVYAEREARREAGRHGMDQLYYEVMHNLVLETTRMAIEVKNLKMRVESLTGAPRVQRAARARARERRGLQTG